MFTANLLLHLESFIWEDLSQSKSKSIDDLALALVYINDNGDIVYNHPDTYKCVFGWGHLFEMLYFDDEKKASLCPWLTHDNQKTLIKLLGRSTSPNPSSSLQELKLEFENKNNGWVGISAIDTPYYVSDIHSWEIIHQSYVYEYYNDIDKTSDYFKRFYIPKLRVAPNVINNEINKGLVNDIFKRIDTPTVIADSVTLHGEQIQMHFKDDKKSALNLNGVWKHKKLDLLEDAKRKLIEWGFKLTD